MHLFQKKYRRVSPTGDNIVMSILSHKIPGTFEILVQNLNEFDVVIKMITTLHDVSVPSSFKFLKERTECKLTLICKEKGKIVVFYATRMPWLWHKGMTIVLPAFKE
jgi:hypothetical protein